MDKLSRTDVPIEEQRTAWNKWNAEIREKSISEIALRQAEWIESRIERIETRGTGPLSILEVGCGTGWMCERLARFGTVTGTDLADEVVARASVRLPATRFVAGDFLSLKIDSEPFDVVVSIDTLSHLVDQMAFMRRVASLLRPSGVLLIGTQNAPILSRWSAIPGPQPGQVRRWVDHRELRGLLSTAFNQFEVDSICPVGDQGFLRLVNSVKLNRALGLVFSANMLERAKNRALLGHSLMAAASQPRNRT